MHHRELIQDLNFSIQDILVSNNSGKYGSLREMMLLILERVINALMNQKSSKVPSVNIIKLLEGSFMFLTELLV